MDNETVQKTTTAAKDALAGAGDWLSEQADQLSDLQKKVRSNLVDFAKEKPLTAIGVAVALGVLLGRLTR